MPKYDLKGIQIQGGFFVDPVRIDLFSDEKCRAVVLYGKNGSGKTSIARAINELAPDFSEQKDFLESFYDIQNLGILAQDQGFKICVFSDWFKTQNTHFEKAKKGLGSIVLFGKSKELDDQIENLYKQNTEDQKKIDSEDIKRFDDPTKSSCILALESNAKEVAKKSWCVRDKEIRKNQNASHLTDAIFNVLSNLPKPVDDLETLENAFQKGLAAIKDINGNTPPLRLPILPALTNLADSQICSLLNKQIEKRSAGQFESAVIEALQHYGLPFVRSAGNFASSSASSVCPFCLQEVSSGQKHHIREAIEHIFNDEIKEETSLLNSAILTPLAFDLTALPNPILSSEIVSLEHAIVAYNGVCSKYNLLIKQKIDSIYESIGTPSLGLDDAKKQVEAAYQTIEEKVAEINFSINEYSNKVTALKQINDQIAYYELFDSLALLQKAKAEKNEAEKRIAALTKEIDDNKKKIRDISAAKANTKIALDEINHQLFTIFSSKTRLYLSESDTPLEYSINSNGRQVRFEKLSDGEKNAISIVYFFESLKSGSQAGSYFLDPCLLVLDDPISSFDFDNKLGILAYLRAAMTEVFTGNPLSKIAAFTHEFDVACSFSKIYTDIHEYSPSLVLNQKMLRISKNHITQEIRETSFSNYRLLIEDVFEFASLDPNALEHEDPEIGNEIRKLLEAYATFNYRCTGDNLLTKSEYLNKIKDPLLRSYFGNRMFRLVLNSDSHTQYVASSVPDVFSFDLFSYEEKIKTARETLAFLYLLDPQHVVSYLSSKQTGMADPKIQKIEEWISDISSLLK